MATKRTYSTSPKLITLSKDEKSLEMFDLSNNFQQWSEPLKARLFGTADKDGNYFSYLFLDKIFGKSRSCKNCGSKGTPLLQDAETSLKLYVVEGGIIGKHTIQCENCKMFEEVVSGDDASLLPTDSRLEITGEELRDLCKKVTHFEVLHDLMEILHIAGMEDDAPRKEKYYAVAAFMLRNARKICEEWCRPENNDLRQRKYLRLREETLLIRSKRTSTPDMTEEYGEMYDMMADSFRKNRDKLIQLLCLIKCQLIDNPCRSTFMTWVGITMMQTENYPMFKRLYDPRCFMKMESNELLSLKERYLSLDVPLGIKKIPVVFVLFEIPRFFYYAEFLNQRLGKKRAKFVLTDSEREELMLANGEVVCLGLGSDMRKGKKKTMICSEPHLNYLSQQEDMDRERLHQTCR